mmetsp:Transcript_15273/g.30643  ORF Transcript_15273/g.30643 Transcript_15273/m.30643 type:complete len:204 (-) Transcript_15273:374-985(-)
MPPKRKAPEPAGEWSSLLEGKWVPYSSDDSKLIEKAWEEAKPKRGAKTVVVTALSFARGAAYEFDFDAMTQINPSTKRPRKIQRTVGSLLRRSTAVCGPAATSAPDPSPPIKKARGKAPVPASASPMKMSKAAAKAIAKAGVDADDSDDDDGSNDDEDEDEDEDDDEDDDDDEEEELAAREEEARKRRERKRAKKRKAKAAGA